MYNLKVGDIVEYGVTTIEYELVEIYQKGEGRLGLYPTMHEMCVIREHLPHLEYRDRNVYFDKTAIFSYCRPAKRIAREYKLNQILNG